MSVYVDVLRYRELFSSLVRRDLRAKYKGSVLGLAWTLALPVALMLVYLVVFSVLWKAQATDLDDYWLFLLCGLPPWAFFASSLQTGARSLVENAPLIRKVRFPRQLVPLSVVATQLVAFAVMTAIVLGLALWFRPDSRDTAWLALPAAALIVVFVAGFSLAIAALNAVFRDVEFIVAAALLPWFFLTPVLYQLDDLPGALKQLIRSLEKKAREFKRITKSGRTHLQDAVPVTLGQAFQAHASALRKDVERLADTVKFVRKVGVGGNAVGTGLNTFPEFRPLIMKHLSRITGRKFEVGRRGFRGIPSERRMVPWGRAPPRQRSRSVRPS